MNDLLQFEADLRARQLSVDVVRRYVRVLEDFRMFVQGTGANGAEADLAHAGRREIEAYLRERGAEGSRSAWNRRLSALRAFYDFLFRSEVIEVNPALRIERLKIHGKERDPLSLDEVIRLVDAFEHNSGSAYRGRNVALVQVFFHCALRVSEVISLDLAQFDLEHRLFRDVRRKGDKHLSALFNDVVAEAIERYLPERQALLGNESHAALFVSDRGRRLSKRAVQDLMRRYGELANIHPTVTPHRLRHSSVTELVDMGAPLSVAQEICGHSSSATTERYVHVKDSRRRRAVDELGERYEEARCAPTASGEVPGAGFNEADCAVYENRAECPNECVNTEAA
ncbi:MAG: tyrosine-type recombinase/integrase [Deltaproteobacteria bacterium]|nr:tyrosine-type recombinase/integrase [Deltaproteobacteria bacterium]